MSKRTTVRSHPERAHYDNQTFHQILDRAIVGHVCIVRDGLPHVVPMMIVRMADEVFIHCRAGTQLALDLASGQSVAISIATVRGIVFAKSVRYHAVNYDSLVIHGIPRFVSTEDEKAKMFTRLVDHAWEGRSKSIRPPSREELASVDVFALNFTSSSAKIRRGGPAARLDQHPDDASFENVWTGWADLTPCVTAFHPVIYPQDEGKAISHPDLKDKTTTVIGRWKGDK